MLQVERIALAVLLSGVVLLGFTCRNSYGGPVAQEIKLMKEGAAASNEVLDSFDEVSEHSRIALIEPCGRCHQSGLDTHKKAAIAVFDLDLMEMWHSNLKEDHLKGLIGRAEGNQAISKEELEHIKQFVSLKEKTLSP